MNSIILDKKERERDRRLRKTYGITLEQWREIYRAQGERCAICGRHFGTFNAPPNVDHIHFKILAFRCDSARNSQSEDWTPGIGKKGWMAIANLDCPQLHWKFGKTKVRAIALAKEDAKSYSVRGLLCPGRHGKAGHGCCNRLLGRVDDRNWLLAAAAYLENPPARNILTNPTQTDTLNP